MPSVSTTSPSPEERIAALEAELAAQRDVIATLTRERDALRASHERLRQDLELLRRRIFVAKAERVDSTQLELEFAAKLAELDRLGGKPATAADESDDDHGHDGRPPRKGHKKKPTGRRDLRKLPLEEVRIELPDPAFDQLVADGKAERIGFEDSYKLAWQRGGMRRLVVARVKYRAVGARGVGEIETAPMPAECLPRALAAPSMIAHLLVEKFCDGMPFHRIEDRLARDGVALDRGTMSRYAEQTGGTFAASVVAAMKADAMSAFCIATDATGIGIQPMPSDNGRRACRRGHFFVLVADRDHVLFEYTAKETSAAVKAMLHGYAGYVQADAKSVYDALFREPNKDDDPDRPVPSEVGCWAHARRKFWEATIAKSVVAREGLARVGRIFELDASWADKPPSDIKRLRQAHLAQHVQAFFAWAETQYDLVRGERGALRSALGYAVRQRAPLARVLEDGRLVLDNNRSERALRTIAVGRKAWLFCGSDDHAEAAAAHFTLIASARLHGLDPETYLRDLLRVLPHWPKDRNLELAPKYWAATRARLDAWELELELGPLTVPPPEEKAVAG
jgi:transposase/uncharacterized coiled-coil protein SlyX